MHSLRLRAEVQVTWPLLSVKCETSCVEDATRASRSRPQSLFAFRMPKSARGGRCVVLWKDELNVGKEKERKGVGVKECSPCAQQCRRRKNIKNKNNNKDQKKVSPILLRPSSPLLSVSLPTSLSLFFFFLFFIYSFYFILLQCSVRRAITSKRRKIVVVVDRDERRAAIKEIKEIKRRTGKRRSPRTARHHTLSDKHGHHHIAHLQHSPLAALHLRIHRTLRARTMEDRHLSQVLFPPA